MVIPDNSLEIHHAGRDISSGSIFVEGEVVAGHAACLVPRRYRKRPDWWAIDVVSVEAPTGASQQFRLSCAGDGLWGTAGIEIVGPSSSIQILRQEPSPSPEQTNPAKSGKLGSAAPKLSSKSGKLGSAAPKLSSKSGKLGSAAPKLNSKSGKLTPKARRVASAESPKETS